MKRSTIYDIAEMAGVSVTTVTRAFKKGSSIRPETRDRILRLSEDFNYTPNMNAVRLAKKTVVIGAILDTRSEELYNELKLGLEAACKNLAGFKVDLEIRSLPKESIGTDYCEKLLDELLEVGVQGLILLLVDYLDGFIQKVNEAVDNGLFVTLLINECDRIKRTFSVNSQPKMSGRIAAELLSTSISGNEVAVFIGNSNPIVHQETISGFRQEAEERDLSIVEVSDFKENLELSRIQTREVVRKYPGLGGVFVTSANSDAIVDELVRSGLAGSKIKIVTTDLYPQIANNIESGAVLATIYKNPYQQAKSSFELLFKHINGTDENMDDIYIIPQIIIKGNLPAFKRDSVVFSNEA